MLEVSRILKPGGTYMLITYGDPSVRVPHLNKTGCKWKIMLYVIRVFLSLHTCADTHARAHTHCLQSYFFCVNLHLLCEILMLPYQLYLLVILPFQIFLSLFAHWRTSNFLTFHI
ncbi:protein Rf1, mitochondrial-like [Iris pallida]|uniref:Protein Rf1, mitochondrial-like n=2 Tax=Iris pallida TaxID=29817 RepID=A0AAX6G1R9_IRIPA|nr:protein Rf1, mitochondrial-like [Iris pallida]